MAQFESIIAQIAAALSITSLDVYVFFAVFMIMGIIAILGLMRIYSILLGMVLWIGIFVLISTILSPEYQTPETLSFMSESLAKLFIGSSVYLIFILTFLVPINGGIIVTLPRNPLSQIFQTLVLSGVLVVFYLAVFLWLVERSYIFLHTESAFTLIKTTSFYLKLQSSLLFTFVTAHLPTIIILSIGFIIYKILFSDIIHALLLSLIASIKKHKARERENHMSELYEEQWEEGQFWNIEEGHDEHGGHEEGWHEGHSHH